MALERQVHRSLAVNVRKGTLNLPALGTGLVHEYRTVAKVDELRPGRGLRVEVEGRVLALFKVGEEVRALDNLCAHRGGALSDGELDDGVVTCPLHGWAFDTASGHCVTNPGAAVRAYPVRIEDGKVQVAL